MLKLCLLASFNSFRPDALNGNDGHCGYALHKVSLIHSLTSYEKNYKSKTSLVDLYQFYKDAQRHHL